MFDKIVNYRLVTFLSVTSIAGILLIIIAVYNASRDLEIIHEVRALNEFVHMLDESYQSMHVLKNWSVDSYMALIVENGRIKNTENSYLHGDFPLDMTQLEQSRLNENGGYVESGDMIYTWALVPKADTGEQIVLIHKFTSGSLTSLVNVYTKRLLVPALFYIWLMVWAAYVIQFLVTKVSKQNKTLKHMAMHDNLTGLANRNLLEDRLQIMIEDCRRHQRTFAYVVIDLNKFKEVNDTFGHDKGDELLCLFAARVMELVRAADTFARIGGDEFVLLLHDVNADTCITMCERLKKSILTPYNINDTEVNIGLSIGVSIFPEHGEDSTILMRHADQAMYTSKSVGGGIKIHTSHEFSEQNNGYQKTA
jgi:diguanylate cyclase (GGDEF)-like protein